MMENRSSLDQVLEEIHAAEQRAGRQPGSVRLMAVTKTVPAERVNEVVRAGVTLLGENRVQEFLSKKDDYLTGCEIHFIGTLQKNKVKYLIDTVDMIESVNSLSLAEEISRQAVKKGKVMPVLLEINIGEEASKSGLNPAGLPEMLEKIQAFPGIRVEGLMSIPPICETKAEIRRYFKEMHKLFLDTRAKKLDNINMNVLSMGMSGDFAEAIEEGSTQVRIGTRLFGSR